MERTSAKLIVSASDLVGHLACGHLTVLDGRLSTGGLAKPQRDDPELAILQTRGLEHEARYLQRLKAEGLHVVEIAEPDTAAGGDRLDALRQREADTAQAMREGADIVFQATGAVVIVGDDDWGVGPAEIVEHDPSTGALVLRVLEDLQAEAGAEITQSS